MQLTEEISTLEDKIHHKIRQAQNAIIAKEQGTQKTIVGKRMVNPMGTKALQINRSDNKTMPKSVHTVE